MSSRSPLRRRPLVSSAPKRAGCERSMTSAERSEAREDDVPRLLTCRVASPLVMATPDSCGGFNRVRVTRRGYCQVKPLPLAPQGGSATRNDQRRPRRLLRLRCAPPSAVFPVIHAKASESGGRGEAAPPPVASAQSRHDTRKNRPTVTASGFPSRSNMKWPSMVPHEVSIGQ